MSMAPTPMVPMSTMHNGTGVKSITVCLLYSSLCQVIFPSITELPLNLSHASAQSYLDPLGAQEKNLESSVLCFYFYSWVKRSPFDYKRGLKTRGWVTHLFGTANALADYPILPLSSDFVMFMLSNSLHRSRHTHRASLPAGLPTACWLHCSVVPECHGCGSLYPWLKPR